MDKIWNMVQSTIKGKKTFQIPVLVENNVVALSDINKVDLLGKVLESSYKTELGEEFEQSKKKMLIL